MKLIPPEEQRLERERLKKEEEKADLVLKEKSRLPDEQHHMKKSEPTRM